MKQGPTIPVGHDEPPHGRDRLITLAILAVTLITALAIIEDVAASVVAVAALVGLVR